MEPTDFAIMSAHLKGAPISALMILLCLQRPTPTDVLRMLSGYCPRSVKQGLQDLLQLGLVNYHAEDDTWLPSEKALALVHHMADLTALQVEPTPDQIQDSQMLKNFFTGTCSSGSFIYPKNNRDEKQLQPLPKPPPPKPEKRHNPAESLPDDPKIQQAYLLLIRTGIPDYTAADAIMAPVQAGWESERIIDTVTAWLEYTQSEQGKTIKQPGFLVASRLKGLQDPPEEAEEVEDEPVNPYLSGKFAHLIKS